MYHEYRMSMVPDADAGFIDTDIVPVFETDGLIDLETYPIATEFPDATYVMTIDS